MLSKAISTSKKFAAAGRTPMGEFAQLLYTLLQPHCDDFGRQEGDPFTVKHKVLPTSARTEDEFRQALQSLRSEGLIEWYDSDKGQVIEVVGFAQHQTGLHRKTTSEFPSATPGPLDASERDIEAFIEADLNAKRLAFDGLSIVSVARQVRKGNSYFDILAHTVEGVTIVIEVKRQRITDAAIEQVLAYAELIGGDVLPVVVGHGLAAGLDVTDRGALLVVYNDALNMRQVTSLNVKSRTITLSHVPSELNRTELNRTERNTKAPALVVSALEFQRLRDRNAYVSDRLLVPNALHREFASAYGDGAEAALQSWYVTVRDGLGEAESIDDVFAWLRPRFRAWMVTTGRVKPPPAAPRVNVAPRSSTAAYRAAMAAKGEVIS